MVHGRVGSVFDPAPEVAAVAAAPAEEIPPGVAQPSGPEPAGEPGRQVPEATPDETTPLDELPELNDDEIRRQLESLPRDENDVELRDLPDEARRKDTTTETDETTPPVTHSIIRQMLGELLEEDGT
jgi:hypothetical protein